MIKKLILNVLIILVKTFLTLYAVQGLRMWKMGHFKKRTEKSGAFTKKRTWLIFKPKRSRKWNSSILGHLKKCIIQKLWSIFSFEYINDSRACDMKLPDIWVYFQSEKNSKILNPSTKIFKTRLSLKCKNIFWLQIRNQCKILLRLIYKTIWFILNCQRSQVFDTMVTQFFRNSNFSNFFRN